MSLCALVPARDLDCGVSYYINHLPPALACDPLAVGTMAKSAPIELSLETGVASRRLAVGVKINLIKEALRKCLGHMRTPTHDRKEASWADGITAQELQIVEEHRPDNRDDQAEENVKNEADGPPFTTAWRKRRPRRLAAPDGARWRSTAGPVPAWHSSRERRSGGAVSARW